MSATIRRPAVYKTAALPTELIWQKPTYSEGASKLRLSIAFLTVGCNPYRSFTELKLKDSLNRMSQKNTIHKKEGILTLLTGVLVAVGVFAFIRSVGGDNLRTIVNSTGSLAPLVFIILHALTVIFSPFGGGGVLILSAGVLFGAWLGMIYFILGAFVGALVNFYLGRVFGVRLLKYILGADNLEKTRSLATKLTANSRVILLIALMSTSAFNVLCYACGLSKMKFRNFAIAVVISSLINTPIYVIVGQTFAEPSGLAFLNFLGLILVIVLILGVEETYNKYFSKNKITWIQQIRKDIQNFSKDD